MSLILMKSNKIKKEISKTQYVGAPFMLIYGKYEVSRFRSTHFNLQHILFNLLFVDEG